MKRFLQVMSNITVKNRSAITQKLDILSKLSLLSEINGGNNSDIDKAFDIIKKPIFTKSLEKAKKLVSNKEWFKTVDYCKSFLRDVEKLDFSENEKKIISEMYTLLGKGLCHRTHDDALEAKECFEKALSLNSSSQLAVEEKLMLSVELRETSPRSVPGDTEEEKFKIK